MSSHSASVFCDLMPPNTRAVAGLSRNVGLYDACAQRKNDDPAMRNEESGARPEQQKGSEEGDGQQNQNNSQKKGNDY